MGRNFDGAADYLEDSMSALIVPFTMFSWFNSDDAGSTQTILSHGDISVDTQEYYLEAEGVLAGDFLRFTIRLGGGASAITSTGYTAGTWHSSMGVAIAVDDRDMYIDGGSVGNNVASGTPTGLDTTRIGARTRATTIEFFSGDIGPTAIWSVELNANEISALSKGVSPFAIRHDSLVGFWFLNGDVSPEPDFSGGGFNMTLNGSPTKSTTGPPIELFENYL